MREPRSEFVLGIDIGTSGCKAIAVDCAGQVFGEGFATYPILSPHPALAEQDADEVVTQTIAAARECLAHVAGAPVAICFGGALHSLLAVDANDHPLTLALTWGDNRSHYQAQQLKQRPDSHTRYLSTGCPSHPMYPLAKIIWLRDTSPQIFRNARRFVSIKEYVTHAWTGEWAADEAVASGSGMLNLQSLQWDTSVLDLIGIEKERLSPVVPSKTTMPRLCDKVAHELGHARDIPVVLGGSDAAFSNIGAGAISPGTLVIMIGSSGAVRVIAPQPLLDSRERTWCYVVDQPRYLVGGAINNGGLVLGWFAENFVESATTNAEELLVTEAGRVKPGADGLVFLPYLAGERSPGWNPHARGVLFGLSLHHGRPHVARALLESVAYRIRSVLEAVEDVVQPVAEIRASGGFLRSDLWVQILSDVLGRTIRVPATGNTSALGAALWAWYARGDLASLDSLEDSVPIQRVVEPDAKRHAHYTRLYDLYRDLYDRLGEPFSEISEIQSSDQE